MSAPGRLALVAGSGDLVPQAIAAARAAGWEVRVLSLHPRADLADENPFPIKVSRPDQVLREIRKFKATHVCAVGGMHMSDRERETFAEFAGEKDATAKGDSRLSQLGAALLKILGLPFIGVHEIVSDLLAPAGQIGAVTASDEIARTAEFAFDAARKAGALDLGQALVVTGGRIVATEDIGGTDELLHRCRTYRERGLIGNGRGHIVMAKTSKPGQPLHVDLPAIGERTIELAREVGIEAIVVEAGRTLLIGRAELVSAADAAGIALIGLMASND
ncbi:UDP-2,3-diacylglucosamine diphosphatase LpxI domain-containing protein [Pelagibacterium sp. H642]|uniref:UDP-2,3-diacylglucosamine diphosphatase LpxI domain-containing protein n=1 Tax=Pelagibacterium sp. H642 TaxID=1881069 RepID=UPI002815CA3B|nr:UDP-2,3-diacylglucosamine diphosphatase LpxI [Pelagibacterium sp. H642]WMT90638.1 UDP-2,3-diacylglucosamine diphosphatase LpxI [Pelagibacterium sp. H642]